MADQFKMLDYLTQVEELAEDVLADRQKIIDLDRKRQKTREAVRIVRKDGINDKMWICMGNMFVKLPKKNVTKILDEDFDELDKEITNSQKDLKHKVDKLYDAECKDSPKGFNLNPLSKEEMNAIQQML